MSAGSNAPTIIKKKKITGGDGHHGGAWKVAYADFVTAMMAFFMLMWLLNATTEQQRKGIADYFAPTISISRVSGGGSDAFGGDNIFTEQQLAQSGTGINQPTIGMNPVTAEQAAADAAEAAQVAALRDIEAVLLGVGGESLMSEQALRHIVTRLTDEGLVIEIFDLPNATLFPPDSVVPNPVTVEVANILARLFQSVSNEVAVTGHLSAKSVLHVDNPLWELSMGRATQMRLLLEDGGLNPLRIARVSGAGDRNPAVRDATAPRNNRLEIVLLRDDR
ncbi:flagellar motor protein MotB [Cognatiyoonia sp. IB215446]|uniref:flagellar motor protein MotB n=1 Tax=Cognatiyoonia sp. IB215446 TaxID=3097355 RepID=UPI002A158CEC|nr:flagellar motor protein MotB [Cognatiyoonia sp. IB215446]MDX8350353.1 flagellar motor protein MotB [Cognatiyoonia sp. IB215446]